jgi:hypothetical protein
MQVMPNMLDSGRIYSGFTSVGVDATDHLGLARSKIEAVKQ